MRDYNRNKIKKYEMIAFRVVHGMIKNSAYHCDAGKEILETLGILPLQRFTGLANAFDGEDKEIVQRRVCQEIESEVTVDASEHHKQTSIGVMREYIKKARRSNEGDALILRTCEDMFTGFRSRLPANEESCHWCCYIFAAPGEPSIKLSNMVGFPYD